MLFRSRWEATVAGKQATFDLDIVQKFQEISGTVSFNGTSAPIENARLTGEEISFTVADARDKSRYEFSGRLTGGRIVGDMRVVAANAQRQLEWTAQRTELRQPAHALLKKPTIQELQLVQ